MWNWSLIFAWSVFWTLAALAPFCEGWAAAEAAASHAAPAFDRDGAVPSGEQCCHLLSDASVLDPKPELSQCANAVEPVPTGAWKPAPAAFEPAVVLRIAPAPPPRLPVFLDTRRLRI